MRTRNSPGIPPCQADLALFEAGSRGCMNDRFSGSHSRFAFGVAEGGIEEAGEWAWEGRK